MCHICAGTSFRGISYRMRKPDFLTTTTERPFVRAGDQGPSVWRGGRGTPLLDRRVRYKSGKKQVRPEDGRTFAVLQPHRMESPEKRQLAPGIPGAAAQGQHFAPMKGLHRLQGVPATLRSTQRKKSTPGQGRDAGMSVKQSGWNRGLGDDRVSDRCGDFHRPGSGVMRRLQWIASRTDLVGIRPVMEPAVRSPAAQAVRQPGHSCGRPPWRCRAPGRRPLSTRQGSRHQSGSLRFPR